MTDFNQIGNTKYFFNVKNNFFFTNFQWKLSLLLNSVVNKCIFAIKECLLYQLRRYLITSSGYENQKKKINQINSDSATFWWESFHVPLAESANGLTRLENVHVWTSRIIIIYLLALWKAKHEKCQPNRLKKNVKEPSWNWMLKSVTFRWEWSILQKSK